MWAASLMRGRASSLQLLLVLANAAPQGSSYFTFSNRDVLQPERRGHHIYVTQEHGGPVIPQALGSVFVASYDSQGCGGGIRTRLHLGSFSYSTDYSLSQVKLYYDRRSVGQSVVVSGTHLGPTTNFFLISSNYFLAGYGFSDVWRPL
jgi:hypothetical protein